MPLDGIDKVERQLEEIKSTLFSKVEELEKQSKKRGEDAVTKDEWSKVNAALDKLKDDYKADIKKRDDEINALHKKANRPVVADTIEQKKAKDLDRKHNREVAEWFTGKGVAAPADEAKAAAFRKDYGAAFGKMLRRTEKALDPEEMKALSVGVATDGGFWVDPARASTTLTKVYETSDLRGAGARVESITSNLWEEPIDRDEASSGWVGEQSTRSETNTPGLGMFSVPVHEMYALLKSTQNLLDDAGRDVEGWLDVKAGEEFARQENGSFVTGNGVSKPRGFTSYTTAATADSSRAFGTIEHVATGSNGAFKALNTSTHVNPADDLFDLIYKFKKDYRRNLRWGGNRLTLGGIRKFKDANENYIYDARLTANGIVDFVFGYPFDEFADMAGVGTTGALALVLADWARAYIIIDRQGIRQLRDNITTLGQVKFYSFKRVGGAVRDSDAIKFIKLS